jgi:asparagine synthase (glutamine-hydrolysing)
MCGICGIVDPKGVETKTLHAMRDVMLHRGPDDAGSFINLDHTVGLAHRRLSIIDLSPNGRNPLPNEDGSIQIVFNGEFYNYREFIPELKQRGHVFYSDTDTEVIVHLYEEYGLSFVDRIRGMFALAIWDEAKRKLILARDRVGIKPLYYTVKNNALAFASELKGLQFSGSHHKINPVSLDFYFALGYIPNPLSIYSDIHKLQPGHFLIWDDGKITDEEYWHLPSPGNTLSLSENELLDCLQDQVEDAVKLRLIADVPLGVFLSGGVDSSIVACVMSKFSNSPVKTFSIGFKEDKFNELPYARQVAAHIHSEHHELIVEPDASSIIRTLVRQFDEPLADSSAIPQFYVSQLARQFVTVALGGDGGDELFGGYNWYSWVNEGVRLSQLLGPFAKIASAGSAYWPQNFPGRNFLERLGHSPFDQFKKRIGIFDYRERLNLFAPDLLNSLPVNEVDKTLQQWFGGNPGLLDAMQRTDFHLYLPEDILTKVDRTSMLVSLEARVPLLDHRLVEFAFAVPQKYKIHGKVKKYLLKRLAQRLLPADYPLERKQGFSIPVARWLRNELAPFFTSILENDRLREHINLDYVKILYKEHRAGGRDHSARLWAVLCWGLWVEHENSLGY